jgi:hypothetical protein
VPADDELYEDKRQLLTTAVGDVKGSIHANDQKVAAALVVNGLLFTGVVTVLTRLEGIYTAAQPWQHWAGGVLLAVSLVNFTASVAYLLGAMKPYRPKQLEKTMDGKYPRVFFPRPDDLEGDDPFGPWRERIDGLQRSGVLDELTAELLKLADILHTESKRASKGYKWLALEGLFVLALLVFVSVVAVSQL